MVSHGITSSMDMIDAMVDAELHLLVSRIPIYIFIEMDTKKVKMREEQITTGLLGKVFRLLPDSIILCTEDGELESPDEYRKFSSLLSYKTYACIGEPINSLFLVLLILSLIRVVEGERASQVVVSLNH